MRRWGTQLRGDSDKSERRRTTTASRFGRLLIRGRLGPPRSAPMVRGLVMLMVLSLCAVQQVGRVEAASLKGLVIDPDGKAVSAAWLRLFERNSGELHKTRSGDDGSYAFVNIPAR